MSGSLSFFFLCMPLLLLDVDGTITSTWPLERTTMLFMADCLDDDASMRRLEAIAAQSDHALSLVELMNAVFSDVVYDLPDFYRAYDQAQRELLREKLLPSLSVYLSPEMLAWTSDLNVSVGIATGSPSQEVSYVLSELGCESLVDPAFVVDRDTGGLEKATGVPLRTLADRATGKTVFIGDSHSDREGAERANIFFIQTDSTAAGLRRSLLRARLIFE